MNTYKKYCPNVFVAQCTEKHEKGEIITLTTKYGKEHNCVVHNFIGYTGTKEEQRFCYSITREDGFNCQERAKRRAEKIEGWKINAQKRSDEYYSKSKKDSDFLVLAEPIKIGHHSEKRHRKIIEQAQNNTRKWIAESDKADSYQSRIDYWESLESEINLSMPESLDFYSEKLKDDEQEHKQLKENPELRAHSYSLTYANKRVKETKKKLELAHKLWGEQKKIEVATPKQEKKNPFDNFEGLFFAFNNEQFKEGMEKVGLDPNNKEEIRSIGAGGYVRKDRLEALKEILNNK